jgi:hypothetical protein
VLIAMAVEQMEGAPTTSREKLLGGLVRVIGLLGTMMLAVMSAASAEPRVGLMSSLWGDFVALATAWAAWPGLTCAGVWLRRRPTRHAFGFLWLTLSAAYPVITTLSFAMLHLLPRSL